jgi:hypothetical protein
MMSTEVVVPEQRRAVASRPIPLAPQTFDEMMRYAELLAKSDFVPKEYRDKPGNIIAAVQMGREVGFQDMQSLQSIAVINGKPSIYGDAALALVRSTGELEDFEEWFEGEGKELKAFCLTKRRGQTKPLVRSFSVAMAQKAGLWGKDGPWTTYPQRMLQFRARSWNLRDGWGDVLKGLWFREEAQDIEMNVEMDPATGMATASHAKLDNLRGKYASPPEVPAIEGPKGEPVPEASAEAVEPEVLPAEGQPQQRRTRRAETARDPGQEG